MDAGSRRRAFTHRLWRSTGYDLLDPLNRRAGTDRPELVESDVDLLFRRVGPEQTPNRRERRRPAKTSPLRVEIQDEHLPVDRLPLFGGNDT
jgi:hypothetical protein